MEYELHPVLRSKIEGHPVIEAVKPKTRGIPFDLLANAVVAVENSRSDSDDIRLERVIEGFQKG